LLLTLFVTQTLPLTMLPESQTRCCALAISGHDSTECALNYISNV